MKFALLIFLFVILQSDLIPGQNKIDFGIFASALPNQMEIRIRPNYYEDGTKYLTNAQFTVKWPVSSGITSVTNGSAVFPYSMAQQGLPYIYNGYYYQVWVNTSLGAVSWAANQEVVIQTFTFSGPPYPLFEIAHDNYVINDINGDYWIEISGNQALTGILYNASAAYYKCELKAKVILQSAYNTTTGLMNTTLKSANLIPVAQPYSSAPWNYTGTEHLTVSSSDIVDWILVELRDANTTTVIDRRAGLLMTTGDIKDTNLTSGLIFPYAVVNNSYYITILHRNHLPVMSGSLINIPNSTTYDFSDTLTFRPYGGGKKALIQLEGAGIGKFAMIGGDVNNNGIIRYSGTNNDRAPILTKLVQLNNGISNINVSISNIYLNEDVNLNGVLKYSGSGNDPQRILLNLSKMNNSTSITGTFTTTVPVALIYNH